MKHSFIRGIRAFDWQWQACGPYTSAMEHSSRGATIPGLIAMAFLSPLFGQQETVTADSGQAAQQFVAQKLPVWQQRLKLTGWHISTAFVHRVNLPAQTLGGIKWDKGKKTAEIWILDPSEYNLPLQAMLDDMELTLVHELVHLDLASLPKGQASRSSEEHAVEGLAQAMLALDRAKQ